MDNFSHLSSSCRYCRSYTPEGRRGGHCGRLDVAVMGHWEACPLASPPFAKPWSAPVPLPPLVAAPVVIQGRTCSIPLSTLACPVAEPEPAVIAS
ncbi:MAG: hypothetical protein VKK80_11420 [Prochlorothrix sp.]|nr:hypothetical protein [Prochlorothrix sp.]